MNVCKTHFLNMIINGKVEDYVHWKLIRYSKGSFPGPNLQVSLRGNKLSLSGDPDYEGLIGCIFVNMIPEGEYLVKGTIISYKDLSSDFSSIGFPLEMKSEKRVFKLQLNEKMSKTDLEKLYSLFNYGYFMLSIMPTEGSSLSLKTKTKLPKPSVEKTDAAPKFCKAKLQLEDKNRALQLIPCVTPELTEKISSFSKITVENEFIIEKLILPENKDSLPSSELRVKSKRRGVLRRLINVDGKVYEFAHRFVG